MRFALMFALLSACASREPVPTEPPPAAPRSFASLDAAPADPPLVAQVDSGATPPAASTDAVATPSPAEAHDPGPPGPRVKLKGPCVKPLEHVAKNFGKGMPPGFFQLAEAADFDGDGVNDWHIFGGATNITSTDHLYVRRGDCGHYVGTIVSEAAGLAPVGNKTSGLFDLEGESACRPMCCRTFTTFVFRFDGERYRLRDKKQGTRECRPFAR